MDEMDSRNEIKGNTTSDDNAADVESENTTDKCKNRVESRCSTQSSCSITDNHVTNGMTITMSGWLFKRGNIVVHKWRKRFFRVDKHDLTYGRCEMVSKSPWCSTTMVRGLGGRGVGIWVLRVE